MKLKVSNFADKDKRLLEDILKGLSESLNAEGIRKRLGWKWKIVSKIIPSGVFENMTCDYELKDGAYMVYFSFPFENPSNDRKFIAGFEKQLLELNPKIIVEKL